MSQNVCENVKRALPPLESPPAANEAPMTPQTIRIVSATTRTQQPAVCIGKTTTGKSFSRISNLTTVSYSSRSSQSTISGITLPSPERNEPTEENETPPESLEPSEPTNNDSATTNSEGARLQQLSTGKPSSVPIRPARRVIALVGLDSEQERLFNQGYDSDGAQGPFYDAVEGEINIDDYNKDPFDAEPVVTTLDESMESEEDVVNANMLASVENNIEEANVE